MSDDERSSRTVVDFEAESEERKAPAGLIYDYSDFLLCGPAVRDPVLAAEVERHLACHVGPVEEVFHDPTSEALDVEILRVGPTDERPFHLLTTCGMAQRAMAVPQELADQSLIELTLALPPSWCFDDAEVEGDAGWPIRLLQDLARLPHQVETWLGIDHTVPCGEPGETFAPDTLLCGCLLEDTGFLPETFGRLDLSDGRSLRFLHVTTLYSDELDFKIALGAEALLERFEELRMPRVVDPDRLCSVNPDHPGVVAQPRSTVRGTPWWRRSM
ncbi:MAG: suppressor of fused domain protein [Thermoanaerobaculia bacterium]|nr:suppressor of fused domain protein [Thermoanaerobaculia bacterium]